MHLKSIVDCVHDTTSRMITLFIELGNSNSKLKQIFKVGGYRLCIKKELKDHMLLPDYSEELWTD